MGQEQPRAVDKDLITIIPIQPAQNRSAGLSAVKQREIELKTELLKARQAADEIIAEARSKAATIKSGAASSGKDRAETMAEKAALKAKTEAAQIIQGTDEVVENLTRQGEKNFERAVAFIIASVAPKDKGVKNAVANE